MELTGRITSILDVQSGVGKTGNEWKKGGFVIETADQYPKSIAITTWNDLTNLKLKVGQEVTAHIDISSREYNGKWFTEVKAWKVTFDGVDKPSQEEYIDPFKDEQVTDDLPF